jgi:hypothetical protein
MGFFDQVVPEPAELPGVDAPRTAALAPRASMVPRSLPWERVLCGNARTTVALTGARVWKANLTLELGFFFSPPVGEFGSDPMGAQERMLFYRDEPRPGAGAPVPDGPRLAVVFADGRYATNLRAAGRTRRHDRGLSAAYPVFTMVSASGGGGGSETTGHWYYRQVLDLWPLPPAGPLTLVFAWPAERLTEHSVTLNGQEIATAAAHCVDVFGAR